MATVIHRYRLAVDAEAVKEYGVDPAYWSTLSIAAVAPQVTVDVTVDSQADRSDLDAAMRQLGWEWLLTI